MKKRKLKKWVKVALTIIILMISVIVYKNTGVLGELLQTSKYYELLIILSWGWLFVGQLSVLTLLWED